jgi:hypothetical protein
MRAKSSAVIAAATVAAMALTSLPVQPALAAPAKHQTVKESGGLEFSSHRRHRHRNNAAAFAAAAGIVGTIAALAARERYRDRYRHYGYYGAYPYRGAYPYHGYGYYGGYGPTMGTPYHLGYR